MTAALLLGAALVVYNNLINLWPPFRGLLYVPINAALTAALLALALGPFGLDSRSLGLAFDASASLVGAVMGFLLALPVLVVGIAPKSARFVADKRVSEISGLALSYRVLLRVPLGTALAEEVAFRGVLLAALELGAWPAALLSSVAFGLWHVIPTVLMVEANSPGAGVRRVLFRVGLAVGFSSLAGLLLVWLRLETEGLSAPLALHATLNSTATFAAWIATKRSPAGIPF